MNTSTLSDFAGNQSLRQETHDLPADLAERLCRLFDFAEAALLPENGEDVRAAASFLRTALDSLSRRSDQSADTTKLDGLIRDTLSAMFAAEGQ
jgi:hypothetical protein